MSDTQKVQGVQKVNPQPNVSSANILAKITVGEICGDVPEMRRGDGQRWLCDIYCHVMGYEDVKEKPEGAAVWYGEYRKWLGDFRAVPIATGEVLSSAVLIMPTIADERIRAAFGIAQNDAGQVRNIKMAFRLGVTSEARRVGSKGYAYIMRDIVPVEYVMPEIDQFMLAAYGMTEQEQLALDRSTQSGQDAEAEAAPSDAGNGNGPSAASKTGRKAH